MKIVTKTIIGKEHFRSFQNIKQKYPDAVILLRIGDDYISFEQDAEIVSQLTNNELTSIPEIGDTCRFPFNELDAILQKLVKAGKRVAICDQLENPKK